MSKSIYEKLLKAQSIAKKLSKDSENTHHRYKYVSAEAVITEARSALGEAGLGVLTVEWRSEDEKVKAIYRLFDDTGESIEMSSELSVVINAGRTPDKAESAALTQSLSYFLRGLLLLPRVDAEVDSRDDTAYIPSKKADPFIAKIELATSESDLQAIAVELQKAKLPADRRATLLDAYKAKREAITGKRAA